MKITSLKQQARPQTAAVLRPVQSQKVLSTISINTVENIIKQDDNNDTKKISLRQKTQFQNQNSISQNNYNDQEQNQEQQQQQQQQNIMKQSTMQRSNTLKTSMFRPKSSYLGNPNRQINYESKMFTTDVVAIDKHLDNVEELIVKYNNRPKSTEKIQKIGIDLNEKYKQMQRLQEQIREQREFMQQQQQQQSQQFSQSHQQQQQQQQQQQMYGETNTYETQQNMVSRNTLQQYGYDQFFQSPQQINDQRKQQDVQNNYTSINQDKQQKQQYDSQFLQSQQKLAQNTKLQTTRLQSASTKYTYNNQRPISSNTNLKQQQQQHNYQLSSITTITSPDKPYKNMLRSGRIDSAKTIGSPISRNFIQSSALVSQMSDNYQQQQQQPPNLKNIKHKQAKEQKKLQYSQSSINLQQAAEYQQFFQKNANQAFGIAQCVITGKKISADLKKQSNKQETLKTYKVNNTSNPGAEAQIQTEEADTLNESDFVFLDQDILTNQHQSPAMNKHMPPIIEQSPKIQQNEQNLLYQGNHVKVYKPVKEIQQRGRPQTAGPQNLVKRRLIINSNQKTSRNYSPIQEDKNETQNIQEQSNSKQDQDLQEQLPFQMSELNTNKTGKNIIYKIDYSKLEHTFRNEQSLHKSIFKDKKKKIVELTEYLQLILHDFHLEQFRENEKDVDQTISKHNLTEHIYEPNLASVLNTKRTFNNSIQEMEMKKSIEESQIQSTGLRLRRLTAKYGPRVDLVSHGFQHFRVQDIEQFFDPLRLKLMMVPLSDIPNQYTKQGSDFYFIKGVKLQQMKELQDALNIYEEGICEYPDSSYNCKFNKGVILFKLGMFKEALKVYRQITRDEPLDKRIAYNKSLCEIQNGLYTQAIFTIDSYVNNFNERKLRYDKAQKGENIMSYQEKIQMTKANYVPDDQYLFEIYQIRGVACLRANKVVEASRSFQVAHEFKNHMTKNRKQNQQDSNQTQDQPIKIENQQSYENLQQDEEGYTVVTLEQTYNLSQNQTLKSNILNKQQTITNPLLHSKSNTTGIRCEDQAELSLQNEQNQIKLQQKQLRIRLITAKLQKSTSHQHLQYTNNNIEGNKLLKQRLETLEEENENYYKIHNHNNNNHDIQSDQFRYISEAQTPIQLPDQQEDLFSLDADDIMKALDQYDEEHKIIKSNLNHLQQQNQKYKTQKIDVKSYQADVQNLLHVNRNIDQYLDEDKVKRESPVKHGVGRMQRIQSAAALKVNNNNKPKNQFYFTQNNLLINVDKPQGAIAQFITYKQDEQQKKQQDKQFKHKLSTYELENIQSKINNSKELQRLQQLQQEQLSQEQQENLQNKNKNNLDGDEIVEQDILMRPEEFYIDSKRQIRLDKVLLGFEIDPLNDSITSQELNVRTRRQQLEQEYTNHLINQQLVNQRDNEVDLYMKKLEEQRRENEQMKNKEYFLQFLKVEDKDVLLNKHQHNLAVNSIKELDEMQQQIGGIRQYIDQTFADPSKTALNLDKNLAMAQHLTSLLEQTGQAGILQQSSKLLESLSTTQHSNTSDQDIDSSKYARKKPQKITRRFNLDQINLVLSQYELPVSQRDNKSLPQILSGLKFFIKFPQDVRQQLFDMAILRQFNKGDKIFDQGDRSDEFYVIVKGSVCVRVVKEELGNVPVNTRIAYDGDYIGELAYFEESESLSPEIIEELHKQRATTTALETPTYLLQLNKQMASHIINSPVLQVKYEKRINFLRQLDIFSDIDMYILLPLASNIQVRRYKIGEYIVKAGELPDGLIIVKEGQCLVCAEKLAMRSNQQSEYQRLHPMNPNVKTNPTGSSHIINDKNTLKSKNQKQTLIRSNTSGNYFSDSLRQVNTHHRTYQNEQILVDDKGRRMKDFTVYKDLMVFFNLLPKSYFGGRVLLPIQNKKETEDERRNQPKVVDGKRRGAWFAGGHSLKHSTTNVMDNTVKQVLGDFEHLFIKRRYSLTTQKIMKNDRSSMLSVIANSSEVEVYLIDQQLLDFFPEPTQKHICSKLMHVFEPDRPYMLKNVQKIKDKFREWDVYKIKSYQEQMKNGFNNRKAQCQQQVVQLDR